MHGTMGRVRSGYYGALHPLHIMHFLFVKPLIVAATDRGEWPDGAAWGNKRRKHRTGWIGGQLIPLMI